MKFRNKKTGKIAEWDFGNWYQHILNPDNKESYECTLSEFIDRTAKFREDWEDYKEPKDIWWLDNEGNVNHASGEVNDNFKKNREIGNYFLSREEAELAVRKLKAWKRLKDKGIKATSSNICGDDFVANFKLPNHTDYSQSIDDFDCILDLGGEE